MQAASKHKFIFVGDVVCEKQPQFSPALQELFDSAILKSCNFEAPIKGVGSPIHKTGPHLAQNQSAAQWVQDLGFNCFAMANNHINDFGEEALLKTMQLFPVQETLGVGNEQQAYQLKTRIFDDVKYGFLAYGENGYGALNGDRKVGHAWVNAKRVNQDIQNYKSQVDVLIVQVHAGVELLDVPIPEWKDRYKELIDLGADVIIAHHPHIVQGIEEYNQKLIVYSLGNFYFDYHANHPQWNIGAVLELEFENKNLNQHFLHIVEKKKQTVELKDKKLSLDFIRPLSEKLNNHDYEEYVNKKAVEEWKKHHANYYAKPFNGLAGYSISKLLKHAKRTFFNRRINYNLIWHNLFIESNKWLVERAIRIKTFNKKI
ncbi:MULTISPECIES: CapA family protein [Sphingobacterium]|uniref:Capsule synthesis protein CapA domain-containing protein n=1 Tax=Sphingobacterium cellulitidis TaxID=1768011 RepID=A0A8H9KW93_9SPHI|nr:MULTISPECIES: CapA family protein [Sphingobacterium]MBA8985389.1 poly-gamma-glutamate synthesis protein (capsule biosynthesis protein) [Sphingobacterium soli]WFB63811.1 CapA family protein [Sphingobacterium sp. WM]GGE10045.1 hypothetical protein GCM10011516_04700 [Sphingobacterium soli]